MRFPSQYIATSGGLLTSVFFSPGTYAIDVTRRAAVCNGYTELCDRSFGNVTFVGTHNSYAVGAGNVAVNQDYNITQQLNDGIRMLQSQAHNYNGVIELCHTSCVLFDGGSLQDYLASVKSWMDVNTNDVVSLLIVNDDHISPAQYDAVFKAVGLDQLAYAPQSPSLSVTSWPTLGSLIDSGKRLLVFLSASADFNAVPYLISEFTNIWETAFDVTTTFDCAVNRTDGTSDDKMYLINHFLDKEVLGFPAPNPEQANTTNAISGTNSLGEQLQVCVTQHDRYPNFMLVDFYEYGGGSVFQVAADANGVTYNKSSLENPPSISTSGAIPSSTSGAIPSAPAWRALIGGFGGVGLVSWLAWGGHNVGV